MREYSAIYHHQSIVVFTVFSNEIHCHTAGLLIYCAIRCAVDRQNKICEIYRETKRANGTAQLSTSGTLQGHRDVDATRRR